jgi:hypothetical protein
MPWKRFAATKAMLAAASLATAAGGLDGASDSLRVGLAGPAWSVSVNKGRPDYRLLGEAGGEVLELRSSKSSFGFQRKVRVELSSHPVLSWRWRADLLPAGGDYRRAETCDQAAQLYVAFSPTRALGYVWDSSAPAGTVSDCALPPPFMKVRVMALRSGPGEGGAWALERRDLRRDYEAAFGETMPEAREVGLRIWINSQHTGTAAASAFADLAFGG